MLTIKEYVRAESLEEAYQLNQSRANRIIGGMLWLKMSRGTVQKAIDLSGLGLDTIEETAEEFRLGCMVSLRQMELHEGLNQYTKGAVRDCLSPIVGVQFRNLATVGGSVFGRFGFSDLATLLLALDAYVELYKGGIVPYGQFLTMKRDRDILVRVIVKKTPLRLVYLSHRNTKTDFPVLTCCVAERDGVISAAVGARPGIARLVTIENGDTAGAAERIPVSGNMRGGAEYRRHLAEVLMRRGIGAL